EAFSPVPRQRRFNRHPAACRRHRRAFRGAFRGGAGRGRAGGFPQSGREAPRGVRKFGANTGDLEALAAWLKDCGVKTIAMESTGVYWIPLFELLAAQGFDMILMDPRQTKHAPGRPKSDVLDCQWIQRLHSYGLLTASFRPADEIVVW